MVMYVLASFPLSWYSSFSSQPNASCIIVRSLPGPVACLLRLISSTRRPYPSQEMDRVVSCSSDKRVGCSDTQSKGCGQFNGGICLVIDIQIDATDTMTTAGKFRREFQALSAYRLLYSLCLGLFFSWCLWLDQSICRYFGESIDADNPQIAKKYCDSMCDVRSPCHSQSLSLSIFSSDLQIPRQDQMQKAQAVLRRIHWDASPPIH